MRPDDADALMTAGRFGSETLLSAKALRIYADRGLLPPRWVDPANGYRYYAADQVATGWLIALLRSADLALEQVEQIVHADRDSAVRLLEQSAAALNRRTEARQTVLTRARLHLRKETIMPESNAITPRLEADQPVLSVLRRLHAFQLDDAIHAELARLREVAATAGLAEAGEPFGVFHAPVTDDSDGPLEIVLPVDRLADGRIGAGDDVRNYRLPGGLVATRDAEGPETDFPQILALYDEVRTWITDTGHVPVGPPREIWHNSPRDPEPLSLTVAWPYAKPPG